MSEMVERLAQVLAYQRLSDIGGGAPHDGTREDYWRKLPEQTQELMRLRARSALEIALDRDALIEQFGLLAQYHYAALTAQTMTELQSRSIADAFVTQLRAAISQGGSVE